MKKNSVSQTPQNKQNWADNKWHSTSKKTNNVKILEPAKTSKNIEKLDLRNGYVPGLLPSRKFTEDQKKIEKRKKARLRTAMTQLSNCTRTLGIVTVILLLLSFALTLVGAATPYWFDVGSYTKGLFQYCSTENSVCDDVSAYLTTDKAKSTWRLVTSLVLVGASLLLIASVCLCCFLNGKEVTYARGCFGVTTLIIMIAGSGTAIGGMVVMTTYYIDDGQSYTLNWSYYLCAVGAGLSFLAFCAFFIYMYLFAWGKRKDKD
ncbi:hypothetical protein FSP39_004309 [Pinctada imbricata]|uniref:Uncharacterized protein n=1 Tax=Pinctada imbricata TaxID=66713 RepID=A0AA88XL43_PINIB|nr:hypothetical protein FSP39_004309 [Pinctada imbricata]